MTDNPQKPLVSILVAYYNNLLHIEDSIKSAINQTYPNTELIVVDDCSPDTQAKELIERLQKKYKFSLIRKEKNEGASQAFQTAFEHSSGEYIAILSHDDMYTENKIEVSVNAILKDKLDAVYCNGAMFENDPTQASAFDSAGVIEALSKDQQEVTKLVSTCDEIPCLLTQGAVYSRKIMEELSWIRDEFLLDDWPFTIETWRNYKVSYLDKVVYLYRFHEDNIHKHFWKWFPSRVQTIAQLVDDKDRADGMSFLMSSMAKFMNQNGDSDRALKFAAAGLALSDSTKTKKDAMTLLTKSKASRHSKAGLAKKFNQFAFRQGLLFKVLKPCIKVMIALVPNKTKRKALRERFSI